MSEYICLDYVEGCTLPERFVGLAPEAVAKTFIEILDSLDKHTAEMIDDLGNGSGFSIGDLTLSVRPPCEAGGFVQRRSRACPGGGGVELFGEHRISVPRPARKACQFRQNISVAPQWGLRGSKFSGSINPPRFDLSPACRDTGPALARGFVLLGFRFPNRRDSPDVRFRLVRDSRQRARLDLIWRRARMN
jgi:hypothetical protein